MAQTHTRQPAHTQAPEPKPAPAPAPAPAPDPTPARIAMPPVVTDRQLVEQLRQIYQVANRHMPMPASTDLNQSLCDTLEEIADIAEKAVKGYRP